MKKLLLAAVSAIFAVALAVPASRAEAPPDEKAAAFVQTLSHEVITTIHGTDFSADERNEKLRTLLRSGLDMPGISRFALGRHWAKATEQQLADYQVLFADYLLGTYTRLIQQHEVKSFTVTSVDPIDGKDVVVHTRVELVNGMPLQWDWRVRTSGAEPRIVDLMSNGVSMAVTYRSEFSSVVASNGLDALIESLRKRAATAHKDISHSAGLLSVVASLASASELLAFQLRY